MQYGSSFNIATEADQLLELRRERPFEPQVPFMPTEIADEASGQL